MDTLETPKIYESNVALNTIWKKWIPRTNVVFMIIYILLVFGLDLFIIISYPTLRPFWYVMLIVMGVFLMFFFLENLLFRKKFADHKSALDPWIISMVIVRNIIFFLNFIPVVQLLGLIMLLFIFSPVCLLYIIFIICRFIAAKKQKILT